MAAWLTAHPGVGGHHPGPGDRLRPGGPRGGARRGAGGRPVAPPEEPARRPRAGPAAAIVGHPVPALGLEPGAARGAGCGHGRRRRLASRAGGRDPKAGRGGRPCSSRSGRLHREGHSLRGIASALGLHYRTVERYVRSDACPDWCPGRRRPSSLDRFEDYIRRRLSEGCRGRRQIRDELTAMGPRGGRTAVGDYVRRLEAEMGLAGDPKPRLDPGADADVPSARRLAVAIVVRPEDRGDEDRRHLEVLCPGDEAIGEAMGLAEGFAALVRGRTPEGLSDWLSRAEGCPSPACGPSPVGFARTRRRCGPR